MTTYRKQPKTAKLKPARYARWLHQTPREAFLDGQTVCLALWVGPECDVYDVEPVLSPDGQSVERWTMRKIQPDGEVAEYSVSAGFDACNCPAATYRKSEICKHCAALKAALGALEQR